MNRKTLKLRPQARKLLISLLGIALTMQLLGNTMMFAMAEDGTPIATYEIGIDGNNVIASLTKDGTMTLSGTGDTKDYTAETMPFEDNISNIKDIVIEEGVTSIGNALFYNCKDITGKLLIPSTVVEIGDYAFAGDSYASAPKITKVENSFTQSNIVVETPVEKKADEHVAEKSKTAETDEIDKTDITKQDDAGAEGEQPVQETVKTVKTITEQQIGQSIFVAGQNGGYSSAETNKSFVNAAVEAGYVRADRFVLVKMDNSITQEAAVVDGQLVLPSKPDTLGVPVEDELTTYQFAGWTVNGSDKVLTPKENYSINDSVAELNLTSQWQKTWKINPQVKAEAKEELSTYSIVDSNTGKVLENVNGYTMTIQWQINKKDKDDEKSWENIENANLFTYERKAEAGDTSSYFRAKLNVSRNSNLRSTRQFETMMTDAVSGINAAKPITISYNSNGGTGTMVSELYGVNSTFKPTYCNFTAPTNKVFTGWKVKSINNVNATYPSGNTLVVGEILKPDVLEFSLTLPTNTLNGGLELEAQWDTYTIVYVDQSKGDNTNDGSKNNPVKTLAQAYSFLPSGNGDIETNIIELLSNYTFNNHVLENNECKNVTIRGQGVSNTNLYFGVDSWTAGGLVLNGDLKIDKLTLTDSRDSLLATVSCNWHNFIMTEETAFFARNKLGSAMGVPDKVYTVANVYGTLNTKSPTGALKGTRGTKDDPIKIVLDGSQTNISRVYGGGRNDPIKTEVDNPINIETTINNGKYGMVYAATLTDGMSYVNNYFTVNGGEIFCLAAGGTSPNTGEFKAIINGGTLVGLYGGTYGRYISKETSSYGDTTLLINSGYITELYAGGCTGALYGNVETIINGGTIDNFYGGGYGENMVTGTYYENSGIVKGNVKTIIDGNANIKGNVYAGGGGSSKSIGSGQIIGDSVLIIAGSSNIEGNVYAGGLGIVTDSTAGKINGSSIVTIEGGIIKGNVYGGGELGQIGTKSNVIVKQGVIKGAVFGAGNNVGVPSSEIYITNNPTIDGDIYGGSNNTGITTESNINVEGTINANVFGGGKGADTTVTTSTVNIESTANITGNIYGGGELGAVGTSNVNLSGGTIAGTVFGGGNNVGVTTSNVNITDNVNLSKDDGAIFGGSNAQGTTTTSNIKVANTINKNIYGGGLGSGTTVISSNVNLETGANATGDIYGGGKEGKVTDVVINLNAGTANNVYGGGHLAGVDNSVKINSKAGSKAQTIFGGSNESGSVSNPIITIEGTADTVHGGGKGSQTITNNPSITVTGKKSKVTNIYGGGLEGITKIKSKVTLTQGVTQVEKLYGAGMQAGVEGDTEIVIDAGSNATSVYGGSYVSGEVTGTANVTIAGKADHVFGGGEGKSTLVQNTNVVTKTTAAIGDVYGGSEDGTIVQNTELEIDGTITDSVYGAGKGADSKTKGDTHVVIFGATVNKDVFGGGNLGSIDGNSHLDILSGTVSGSVFGGSNQAKVQGSSKIHVGYNAATDQKKPATMSMNVLGSVFGGGNTTDGGKAFDASNPFVLGNSEVIIDQDGYANNAFSIGKDILGDGNKCVTAGEKTIEIRNFKDLNKQKKIASIQRATKVTLYSSWIELTGSKDSANLLPTVDYSMSRIDTLVLKGNNALYLDYQVNLVRAMESRNMSGNLITNASSASDADGNNIYIQQGKGFELRTNEDVSRPGYGSIQGYAMLRRFDKDSKTITEGVYFLGGYDDTTTNYGFVFGEDIIEIKPDGGTETVNKAGDVIVPETDNKSWNSWRVGRRVDVREVNLTVSDRPSNGKTVAIESTWAADGSIYRIDENSLSIVNQNGSTEKFQFMDPDKLLSQSDINNTFGLEINTGQNGWLEQKDIGYIEGSSATGSTNQFVLQADKDMVSVEDSTIKPLINVTISNLTGITKDDSDFPLLVTFDVNTYTKQADGTEMKTGTMTIKVNILRSTAATYNDTTLEAGKNYKGAIQTYDFDTNSSSGITISQASSITLQYARKAAAGTAVPTKHELSFGTALPAGTKIMMIDKSTNDVKYYHYDAASNITKVALSEFIANGTTGTKYTPITSGNANENYIFVIDFQKVSTFTATDIKTSFTAYNGNTVISTKNIVFSVKGAQRVYTLNSLMNDATTFTKYSIGSTIPIDLSTTVNVTGLDGIDTTGRDKQMGARVRLFSVDNDSYINIPSTWEVISQGVHYSAGGNSFTINLADGLTVTNSNIYIQMSSIGNLPIGQYRLDIDLISGALANYPEDDSSLSKDIVKIGLDLTDYSYSIKATATDKNRQLFSNSDTDKEMNITLEKTTTPGASTNGVFVRQTLYKKQDDGSYAVVDLEELIDPATFEPAKDKITWSKNQLNYKYKSNISAGTYRLKYDVIQVDALNDLSAPAETVRATDTINIVVTSD